MNSDTFICRVRPGQTVYTYTHTHTQIHTYVLQGQSALECWSMRVPFLLRWRCDDETRHDESRRKSDPRKPLSVLQGWPRQCMSRADFHVDEVCSSASNLSTRVHT
jgi:hypothetical protein